MPAETSSTPTIHLLPRHALVFGGGAGLLGAGLNWAQFSLGFYGLASGILLLFVPLIAIIVGVQRWRDGVLGGVIGFPQAFSAALAIGFVYALFQGGFAWLLLSHLEPGLADTIANYQRTALEEAGRSAEQIAAADQRFREQFTPAEFGKQTLAVNLIVAFIGSLVASLFMRRNVAP
jgi:hypothetical protein